MANNIEAQIDLLEEQVTIVSEEDLAEFLRNQGVDLTLWGVGKAKTLTDFYKEIREGEAHLMKDIKGALRKIMPSGVSVYYVPETGTTLYLHEERQVFADGRIRNREQSHSIGEKAKPGEDHLAAAIRGIREELGVDGNFAIFQTQCATRIELSPSFPGMRTKYDEKKFVALLNKTQYRPDGYIDDDGKKTGYFVWRPAPTAETGA